MAYQRTLPAALQWLIHARIGVGEVRPDRRRQLLELTSTHWPSHGSILSTFELRTHRLRPATAKASTVTVYLPVVRCATTFALSTPPSTVPIPTSASARVPSDLATKLAAYIDTSDIMTLLAPKGWICSATYGADGSGGLLIHPSGALVPGSSWGAGWPLPRSSLDEAITGTQPGGSATQGLGYACTIFRSAAAGFETAFGHPCPPHPTSERVRRISTHVFGFEDPPGKPGLGIPSGGRNPANGVNIYYTSTIPAAYIATCTMAATENSLCSVVLKQFTDLYGNR
jgi:hypothetical protein